MIKVMEEKIKEIKKFINDHVFLVTRHELSNLERVLIKETKYENIYRIDDYHTSMLKIESFELSIARAKEFAKKVNGDVFIDTSHNVNLTVR